MEEFNRAFVSLRNQHLKNQKKTAADRLNTAPSATPLKKEKQVELRKVLLETMMLTNVLKE